MLPSIQNFNLAEALNNSQGKTSMALISAGMIISVSLCILAYSTYTHYSEGLATGTGTLSLGVGLLGIRRFTNDKTLTISNDTTHTTTFENATVNTTTTTDTTSGN